MRTKQLRVLQAKKRTGEKSRKPMATTSTPKQKSMIQKILTTWESRNSFIHGLESNSFLCKASNPFKIILPRQHLPQQHKSTTGS